MAELGDCVVSENLAAVGRKVRRVFVITGTGAHRARWVYIWGDPARCQVDKAIRRP